MVTPRSAVQFGPGGETAVGGGGWVAVLVEEGAEDADMGDVGDVG